VRVPTSELTVRMSAVVPGGAGNAYRSQELMRPSASPATLSKWCDRDGSPSFEVIAHSHRRGWHSRARAVQDEDRQFQRHSPCGCQWRCCALAAHRMLKSFPQPVGPHGFSTPLSGPSSTSGWVARGARPSSLTPTAFRRAAGTSSMTLTCWFASGRKSMSLTVMALQLYLVPDRTALSSRRRPAAARAAPTPPDDDAHHAAALAPRPGLRALSQRCHDAVGESSRRDILVGAAHGNGVSTHRLEPPR
jgi:hypothetical protein